MAGIGNRGWECIGRRECIARITCTSHKTQGNVTESGAHNTEYIVSKDDYKKKRKSRGQAKRANARLRRGGEQLDVSHKVLHKILHPAGCESEREHQYGRSALERGEGTRYEREEPPEGAERDETVKVPCRVVRERAALPFELVRPSALFLQSVFVLLGRYDWGVNREWVSPILIRFGRAHTQGAGERMGEGGIDKLRT
jgi:hypothetical protein